VIGMVTVATATADRAAYPSPRPTPNVHRTPQILREAAGNAGQAG
jgi:hypothetical protein